MATTGFVKKMAAACALMALPVASTWADSFSADINDDAFKFEYRTSGSGELNWNASALVHDDAGEIYSAGAQVVGQSLQQANIEGALGLRFYYVDLDNGGTDIDTDGFALGIGGSLSIAIPEVEALSVEVEGYFAPGVLSFGGLDRNVDVSVRALYRVLSNGSVYVGFRKANVDFEDTSSGDLDEGLHVGIHLDL